MVSVTSRISGKVSKSMSGIASRIAEMDEPDANAVLNPASATNRAAMPSPHPGITVRPGRFSRSRIAMACGRMALSLDYIDNISASNAPDCRFHSRA